MEIKKREKERPKILKERKKMKGRKRKRIDLKRLI